MRKIFWAVTFCLMMILSTTVSAAGSYEIETLREAMLANSGEDDRVFHEDLLFFIPSVQSELELFGTTEKGVFKSAGEINIWVTSANGVSTELSVPFYAVQNGKEMKVYFQMDKKWYQFQSPSVAAAVTDMVASPTNAELEEMLSETKTITILRDTDTQRTFLVRLDGEKIAESMKKEFEKNPVTNLKADEKAIQDKFMGYIETGLKNAEMWYTWTVSKKDGKTMTLAIHLSNLLQEVAIAALNDKDQVWPEEIREILESVAYYSEMKSYTTFLNADAKQRLEVPKNVLKAKQVERISDAGKDKK